MHRLQEYFEQPPDPEHPHDYVVVESHYDTFVVSRDTAADVARQLAGAPPTRWLAFRDLSGAWHRVFAAHVYRVSESTAEQRAAARAFWRARRLELEADRRPWEGDD